ncbi:aromatic-ring hydroxylase C-terminal domain-containing protein [Streptomyces rishiriensis]|uniref:aromatic-ring hydroxylase C-terminal domain-containing protein n=1 Tax=Streptomyces rishiriensis TaxID=68264 RepID=UPI0027D7F929|nr:hypothetical protein [Streptomyces rishiriensis]
MSGRRAGCRLLLSLTGAAIRPFDHQTRPGLRIHNGTLHQPPAGWSGMRAALIRPDGHVAWAGADSDDTVLADGLTAALAITHRN